MNLAVILALSLELEPVGPERVLRVLITPHLVVVLPLQNPHLFPLLPQPDRGKRNVEIGHLRLPFCPLPILVLFRVAEVEVGLGHVVELWDLEIEVPEFWQENEFEPVVERFLRVDARKLF